MTRVASFRQSDVERLVRAAAAGGLIIEAVEVAVDGAIRVLTRRPAESGVPVNDDADWVTLAGATQDHRRA